MITKLQLDPGAIAPHRAHATDVGYDIHALHVDVAYIRRGSQNHIWKVLIDTGVHLTPPKGYYFELVPNSRLANTPFMYGNSIGIIDPSYTGSIKVALLIMSCTHLLERLADPFSVEYRFMRETELKAGIEKAYQRAIRSLQALQ